MNILNVAEKPSVARELTKYLSALSGCDSATTSERSLSKYNPVHRICGVPFRGRDRSTLYVTSVTGHVMDLVFPPKFKQWRTSDPAALLHATATKQVKPQSRDTVNNVVSWMKKCSALVLWLDCDREGENIAFEVIEVCRPAKPSAQIFRAVFSALTAGDIHRAWYDLREPDKYLSEAVDCRQELDLRMGAVMTRFLTLRYKNRIRLLNQRFISFGPCQFPTLGFVVDRYQEHTNFQSETHWTLKLLVDISRRTETIEFAWTRGNLYDEYVVGLYKKLCEAFEAEDAHSALPTAAPLTLVRQAGTPVSRKRPLPLTTTAMTVLGATKLGLSSKAMMQIAEALYQKGALSYPRTETNSYHESIDVRALIKEQAENPHWGTYAADLADPRTGNFQPPRRGSGNDKAHPPIHPVKSLSRAELSDDEWRVYDLVSRHFLATCSKDAQGERREIQVSLRGELFTASGLTITARNFLVIFPFDSWHGKELAEITEEELTGARIRLSVVEGKTVPPPLLTEAELIKIMDREGIGTDATMHEHINTIKERQYVIYKTNSRSDGRPARRPANCALIPTALGLALVKGFRGYRQEWLDLSKPRLRAEMESQMNAISQGRLSKTGTRNQRFRPREPARRTKELAVLKLGAQSLAACTGSAFGVRAHDLLQLGHNMMREGSENVCPKGAITEAIGAAAVSQQSTEATDAGGGSQGGSEQDLRVLTWEEFGKATRELALDVYKSGFTPDVVVAIARGGLPLAGAISYALGVKACASINIEFYTDVDTRLDEPVVLTPELDMASLVNKKILLLDDVSDTGATIRLVRDRIAAVKGADVRIATLFSKPRTELVPDYFWQSTSKWISFPWSCQGPVGGTKHL